ncbi:MAG: hypothetical protein ACTSUB_04065 [Candidatus Thorarchaeota archaeon]
MTDEFEVIINGEKILMNEFVSNVIHDVVHAMIKHLRDVDVENISKIEIS